MLLFLFLCLFLFLLLLLIVRWDDELEWHCESESGEESLSFFFLPFLPLLL